MKKTLIILLLYPFILMGQKLDYADEFSYEIYRNLDSKDGCLNANLQKT